MGHHTGLMQLDRPAVTFFGVVSALRGLQTTSAMFRVHTILVEHLGCDWLCAFGRWRAARRRRRELAGRCFRAGARRVGARRCDWLAGLFSRLGQRRTSESLGFDAGRRQRCTAVLACSLSRYIRLAAPQKPGGLFASVLQPLAGSLCGRAAGSQHAAYAAPSEAQRA